MRLRTVLASCVATLVPVFSGSVSASVFVDGSLSAGWEDNLTRGFYGWDQKGSMFTGGSLSVGDFFQPLTNTAFVVSGHADYFQFPALHGFNRVTLGAAVSVEHKFGLGPYTPRISLGASADRDLLQGRERDRDLYSVQVGYAQRFASGWSFSLGAAQETSRGLNERGVDFTKLPYTPGITRPTDPMDYYNNAYRAGVDYEYSNGWLVSLSNEYIDGYIVPTATPPVVAFYSHAKAVAIDPAFDHLQLLYLLKSRSRNWGINLSVPVNQDSAVDLTYRYQDIDARHIGNYRNYQLSLSLVHRF